MLFIRLKGQQKFYLFWRSPVKYDLVLSKAAKVCLLKLPRYLFLSQIKHSAALRNLYSLAEDLVFSCILMCIFLHDFMTIAYELLTIFFLFNTFCIYLYRNMNSWNFVMNTLHLEILQYVSLECGTRGLSESFPASFPIDFALESHKKGHKWQSCGGRMLQPSGCQVPMIMGFCNSQNHKDQL